MANLRFDPEGDGAPAGTHLTRAERHRLLTEIEDAAPGQRPESMLARAQQALQGGNVEQAERLLSALEERAPGTPGLALLQQQLHEARRQTRRESNRRAAEEMLERYIQQRKKSLATLALETLLELVPNHPRREDYERWIDEIDREAELQSQIEAEVAAGRDALDSGDWREAKRVLALLRKLAPGSMAAETFARDLERAERSRAEGASIEQRKQRIEALLAARQVNEAEVEIDALAELSVPKVTLDFLRKRLAEIRAELCTAAELESMESVYRQHLARHGWQAARDVAAAIGELCPTSDRAGEMFDEINRLEAEERRQKSVEQGIATLEDFIAQGRRAEAELALKVLRGLDIDDQQLKHFQQRIDRL
ncbi:MAG: hypothetical protein D6696_08905 [Acidobacteria bacterium]|nr:MAG: hypothetical protein D6696_08905 [Acidobacteriota bacterium]